MRTDVRRVVVDVLVRFQPRLSLELFRALRTLEWSIVFMGDLVLFQGAFRLETFSTFFADPECGPVEVVNGSNVSLSIDGLCKPEVYQS